MLNQIRMISITLLIIFPFIATAQNPKLNVLTTTGMIADTVANIGGQYVDVSAMMGSGVDPHFYQARLGDVSRISRADIILYNGIHLEAGMQKVFEKLPHKTAAVSKDIPKSQLIKWEGTYDPHIWMDVNLWMTVSETIADILSFKDPRNSEHYKNNLKKYLQKLSELDLYIKQSWQGIPLHKRVLVTAHDAFAYYGRAYQVEVKALMGISTLTEAGTGDVQLLAQEIANRKIKAIFVENSIPVKYIEAVQKSVQQKGFLVAVGGELYSDSMGTNGTVEGTYIGMIKKNTQTIIRALK